MVFSLGMYGCESWTIEKAEHRIDAFELWCWRRLLRFPLFCKEIQPVHPKWNQSWIFIGRSEAELKLPYFGHLMQRTDSLEKTLMMMERLKAGKEGDDRGWDGWMASLTWWTWVWVSYGSWWWTGRPGVLQFMGSPRVGHNWVTELNWKICPTRFPGAQSASLHSELPQGGVEGQQLQQHRVQSSRR